MTVLVFLDHVSLLLMWTPRNLKLYTSLHYSPVDENGGGLGPPIPVVHNHVLFLDQVEGEVVSLHNTVRSLTSSL